MFCGYDANFNDHPSKIKAKSILQRDLSRLQMPKMPDIKPEPVEAQSKSPMVIDIDSSPPAIKSEPAVEPANDDRSVAPFPDMGMDMSVDVPKEEQSSLSMPEPPNGMQANPIAEMDFTAPVPIMDQGESDPQLGNSVPTDAGLDGSGSDLNFTTMQFSLAPPEDGQQPDMNASDNFGLGVYDGTDGGQDDLSLSLLPDDNTNNNSNANNDNIASNNGQAVQDELSIPQPAPAETQGNGDSSATTANITDEAMDNILNMDLDGDGNDFDFSLEGDTFNDLMASHDDEGNFDTGMEHGQFDDDFFGLSKTDGA